MRMSGSGHKALKKEELFHDGWASLIEADEVMVDESFEACTSPENRLIIKKLGGLKGRKLLELGCGAGEAAVYFAKKGADVTATDISGKMLHIAQKVSERHNVALETKKAYSHKLDFGNEHFDIVYAANLLHHVDIEETLREIKRVLKKGGIFVSWDALAHNPLIKVYRRAATAVRTENEHPLRMKDLKIFNKYFSHIEINTTWFFTLWVFLKYYFIDKIDPNKERYWKKVLEDHIELEKNYYKLERIDKSFLRLFPFMKRFCWNVVVFAVK